MSRIIRLVSQVDNTSIQTDIQSAKGSKLLLNLIEEYEEDVFVIPEIKGEILKAIVEYLERIKDHPYSEITKPLSNFDFKELLSEWEYNFLQRFEDFHNLFALINGANYLDIKGLFEICCAKAASMIKDLDNESFMEVFQIEPDMIEEDHKNIINQYEILKYQDDNDKNPRGDKELGLNK